jgi:predicted nucleic acid-binding Zn ribbon protein
MIKSYECKDCGYRNGIETSHGGIKKAPCPKCGNCALKTMCNQPQISSEKKCGDLFWRIGRYNGS